METSTTSTSNRFQLELRKGRIHEPNALKTSSRLKATCSHGFRV